MEPDFCVSHNYTQRDLLLLLRFPTPPPPPSPPLPPASSSLYTLFFRIENHHPGILFFANTDQRSKHDKGRNWPKKIDKL